MPEPTVAKPVAQPGQTVTNSVPAREVSKGPKEGDLVTIQFKVTGVFADKSLRLESVKGVNQTGTIVGTRIHLATVHPDVVQA